MSALPSAKKYEEYAYVLDFLPRGRSLVIKGREGPLVYALGEDRLALLELLAITNATFSLGERLYIGREGRTKILSVLGRVSYEELPNEAKSELPNVVEQLVRQNEVRFVQFFNELQPLTPRLHALELIPGIGKSLMMHILKERQKKPFVSFEDITERVGLKEPARLIAKRIVEEISGGSRVNIFVKR